MSIFDIYVIVSISRYRSIYQSPHIYVYLISFHALYLSSIYIYTSIYIYLPIYLFAHSSSLSPPFDLSSDCQFLFGDFLNLEFKDWRDGDVVFANSTCYDDELMAKIGDIACKSRRALTLLVDVHVGTYL